MAAMFAWHHVGSSHSGPLTSLKYGQMEVARLHQRIDGTWFCTLRQHLPYEQRVSRDCRSYESGKTGCEEWARRHEAEIAEFDRVATQRSRDSQHWLGNAPSRGES